MLHKLIRAMAEGQARSLGDPAKQHRVNVQRSLIIAVTISLGGILACQSPAPLVVSGTITDPYGVPPAAAVVALISPKGYGLVGDIMLTDESGHYRIEAAGEHDYILIVVPFSGHVTRGYSLHGYALQLAWLEAGSEEITRDFTLIPGHDFILEAYTADGSLVLNDDWIGLRFVEDLTGEATKDQFWGIGKGEGAPEVPGVCIPLGQKRRFFVQWTVPDFGSIMLSADNGGSGYFADEPGGTVLNLNYELARTQVDRLRANLSSYRTAGYALPPTITKDLTAAEELLAQASSLNGASQAALSDQAMSAALWALEKLELARAEQDIPRYRMGDLTITVLDAGGLPLSGATVAYTQTTHDFLFGVFDSVENVGVEGYKLMRQAGVNYITTGFYWIETEPEQDQIAWEYIDHGTGVLDLTGMGFTLKAHALLALWDFGTPDYVKAMSFDEFDREVYEHISALVSHYRDEIDIWNVINEAHGRGAALDFSRAEITTLTKTGIRAIRENDPDARIIINNAFDRYGEMRTLEVFTGNADDFTISVPAYLDQLAANDVEYDIIGQQLYNGGYSDLLANWGIGEPSGIPTWDLAHLSAYLDQLGEYGKPVHITEQSVSSTWDPEWRDRGAGWWHRHWDEETQAEFLHDFYTIVFSKERAEAITWWNINDNNSFIFKGGLLDEENNPKPAYYALRDLIAGWTTTGQGETDTAGQVTIRGYGGEYEMVVGHNGQAWRGTVHVWEQQNGECVAQTGLQK